MIRQAVENRLPFDITLDCRLPDILFPETVRAAGQVCSVTVHPTPYTLNPTPYALHSTPCTLRPTPYTLHPTPYTLHPTPYTLHTNPETLVS